MTKQIGFVFLMLSFFSHYSHATWSIIVVDPKTGAIGIAGASCTYSVYGIGKIVPGKGAIIVQAMSNPLARMQGVKMIVADAAPEAILDALKDPMFDPEEQQYAVICMNAWQRPLTYTGNETHARKGALTAKGISVQGNTLADSLNLQTVLDAAVKAQDAGMSITEVLMIALEAGAKLGGDRRCGSRTASSAFLTVAKRDDPPKNPYLNLVVYGTDETTNAIKALRRKFDQWKNRSGIAN